MFRIGVYKIKDRKPTTPYEARHIITPLSRTPINTERSESFFGRLKREAMSEPVQAPVPGRGIATKRVSAVKIAGVILRCESKSFLLSAALSSATSTL